MNGRTSAGLVQGWQGTSLVMETALTAITWSSLPTVFKVWSVGCLVMDAFIMLRECILHPVFGKQAVAPTHFVPYTQFNVGMMM
ncbi:hypothetical protein ACQVWE_13455 [Bacillus cereus]|uniref:hypothetical protein n=1 Tax=Bacillus cereus TaxID=1396 RepID=UPI003D65189C